MDRTTDEPDVVIEEYEEIVENIDELSDRVESEDAETESIQEPTSINKRILTAHTGRPSLRSTNARLAGRQEESKPVVATQHLVVPRENYWLNPLLIGSSKLSLAEATSNRSVLNQNSVKSLLCHHNAVLLSSFCLLLTVIDLGPWSLLLNTQSML